MNEPYEAFSQGLSVRESTESLQVLICEYALTLEIGEKDPYGGSFTKGTKARVAFPQ